MNKLMSDHVFHRAIYLTGPTASGKTEIGVALARHLNAEVLALDSMTLYRGMDIATAKPSLAAQAGIPHHLMDVIDPWESASIAAYRDWAAAAAAQVERRGKRVLFVGGTPLYLKALLRGLFTGPSADSGIRTRLDREAVEQGEPALHRRLAVIDPTAAARLHPRDRRRIVRALEVIELTGRPISELQTQHDRPAPSSVRVFGLDIPRSSLHDRINLRVIQFMNSGLVDEVRRLQDGPRPLSNVAAQAIGYREVIAMLAGHATLSQTVERIQARTRQFAKRQATWFRGLEEVRFINVALADRPETVADRLAARIEGEDEPVDSAKPAN
jgi:tRNA dimethylallyltransferase